MHREKTTRWLKIALTAGSVEVLPANPKRVGLIISPPDAGAVHVSLREVAVANKGLTILATGHAERIKEDDCGCAIFGGVNMIGTGGAGSVAVVEILDTGEYGDE